MDLERLGQRLLSACRLKNPEAVLLSCGQDTSTGVSTFRLAHVTQVTPVFHRLVLEELGGTLLHDKELCVELPAYHTRSRVWWQSVLLCACVLLWCAVTYASCVDCQASSWWCVWPHDLGVFLSAKFHPTV